MRRAKIRPSINLSASRRSVAAPATKPREAAAPKPDAAEPKTGDRAASKLEPPPPTEEQVAVCQPHSSQQRQQSHEQPSQPQQEQQQQQQQQQHQQQQQQQHAEQQNGTDAFQAAMQRQPEQGEARPVSPAEPLPDTAPPKPAPESPTKSAGVRRKRITAVPNLGQPRLRSAPPGLAGKKPMPRAKAGPVDREKKEAAAPAAVTTRGGGGGQQEAGEGEMRPPLQPPPVQRVLATSAPRTPGPAKEPTAEVPAAQDPPSPQPKPAPSSQVNHAPPAAATPLRPALSRADSIPEKRAPGSENIYEKKLRELKDRIDSETPSRRRRHYVKQKVQPPERSKMTMSDLIYFNPKTSPMKNTSVAKEKRFPRTIMTEHVVSANNSVNNSAHNSENEDDDEKGEEEEDVDPFAPQVKIGPDGSIMLDSTSLVKDASAAKTLHLSDNDIIQEEASHTTYASFRKRTHTTAWNDKDTSKFYRALSAVGTDFSMINAMFPKRTRQQIKNKFKREERINRQRLDKAIRERQHFDISLFNRETSSDSETENHVTRKAQGKKGKAKGKAQGKGKGNARRKTRKKDHDEDYEIGRDSDGDSINTEVGSNAGEADASRDAGVDEGAGADKNLAGRQSEGSDEEVSMETILSQPTRSGRQPKFKTSFTVEEPRRRQRRKNPEKQQDQAYALSYMERLSRENANALARKQAAKASFPPYAPGGLLWSPPLPPSRSTAGQASTAGLSQAIRSPSCYGAGGSRGGAASPGNRGISTITTPKGRFVFSVPQKPALRQGGTSSSPVDAASHQASPGDGSRKSVHIFVISSPDGTQNIIQVPVQPDPASSDAQQPQSSLQPSGLSVSGPRYQNPMMTPRLMVRTTSLTAPGSPAMNVRQAPVQSPHQHVSMSPLARVGNHSASLQPVNLSPARSPHILMASHRQRAKEVASPHHQQYHHGKKREYPGEPLALNPPIGSNKVVVMSPHAQTQVIPPHIPVPDPSVSRPATHMIATGPVAIAQHSEATQLHHPQHEKLVSQTVAGQHGDEPLASSPGEFTHGGASADGAPYDPAQKVSHMTSDTDTDWLLRDETVGHEVDIPTTDFEEEEARETEEAFIPPTPGSRQPPLGGNETDQVIMGHVTEEHLTAQDILEQMTYEQGVVDGDVGANMEVAINEEIITQIATEMIVE